MMGNKRGISVWISYVMLTALVVVLGFMVLVWSRSTTQETVDDIVARGDALTLCGVSGVDVIRICQDTQTLNMDVTNTNDVKVIGLWARMYDMYGEPQASSRNLSIGPQETKSIQIIKQGIISQVGIMPVVKKGNTLIKCQSRTVTIEPVPVCS
jgi:hypothetical protein